MKEEKEVMILASAYANYPGRLMQALQERCGFAIDEGWHREGMAAVPAEGAIPDKIGTQAQMTIDGYAYEEDLGRFYLHVSHVSCEDPEIAASFQKEADKGGTAVLIAYKKDRPVRSAPIHEAHAWEKLDQPVTLPATYGGWGYIEGRDGIHILSHEEKQFQTLVEETLGDRTDAFANAIRAANQKDPGDADLYFRQTLKQRIAGPSNAGSDFRKEWDTPEKLFVVIAEATRPGQTSYRWEEKTEEYQKDGTLSPGKRCFDLSLPDGSLIGHSGIIDLASLSPATPTVVMAQHGGSLSLGVPNVPKSPTQEAHFIFGTNREGEPSFLITCFPGPMQAAEMLNEKQINGQPLHDGMHIPAGQARALGCTFVKYMSNEMVRHYFPPVTRDNETREKADSLKESLGVKAGSTPSRSPKQDKPSFDQLMAKYQERAEADAAKKADLGLKAEQPGRSGGAGPEDH